MNSLVLGGLLKRIYSTFDMDEFKYRLRLQKIIYLIQAHGIDLGYNYNSYIFGPYCPELTKIGYSIDKFENVSLVKFEDSETEKDFEEFIKKIDSHKFDNDWLEISSSLHLFKGLYPTDTKEKIIKRVQDKRTKFNDQVYEIRKIWDEIEGWIL